MSALFPVFISTFLPRLPIMRSPDLAWAGWAGPEREREGEREEGSKQHFKEMGEGGVGVGLTAEC